MSGLNDTPTMAQMVNDAIDAKLLELRTAMPGIVESYDPVTCLANVSPAFKRRYLNGKLVDLPIITGVPVGIPRAGGAAITFEVQKGDPVILIFAERSLDNWIKSGGKVDPADPRRHHLSDAFAIPGGYPKLRPVTQATVTMAFTNLGVKISNATGNFWFKDNADITFDTGTVQGRLGAGGKVEFENAVGRLINALYTILTTAQAGGFPLIIDPASALVLASFKET